MSITAQNIINLIDRKPTDIYGLKWFPSLEPHVPNDEDWLGQHGENDYNWLGAPTPRTSVHFSSLNHEALKYAFSKLSKSPKVIVEIGIDEYQRFGNETSTKTLLSIKPTDCLYIGIDVKDKSYLDNKNNNVFTIKENSSNREHLYNVMGSLGHEKIDFMFIDGWHSINHVVSEWQYWERMIPNGVMAFHDTNHHPGPVALLDAVDTDIFTVEYFGRESGIYDWGVGVVQRKV